MATTLILPPLDVLATAAHELASAATAAEDTANMHALNKAALLFHQGISITPTVGGFLVVSASRAGTVHRVSNLYGCSCEAGQRQRPCWHAAAIEIIELAASRALPAKPRVRITAEQVRAGQVARITRMIATVRKSAAQIDAETAELWA